MRKNKGITLIALVVTIIVLLILAGISIAMLTGQNGVITKSNEARDENVRAKERDEIGLAYNAAKITNEGNDKSVVDAEDLQTALREDGVQNANTVQENRKIKVTYTDSGNIYCIDENGNIEVEIIREDLKVGDYINYTPDNAGSYSSTKLANSITGSNSNISDIPQDNLSWQILRIYTDGSMDLIGSPTSQKVWFTNASGYNNGVYVINDICEQLYSKPSKGITARSVNMEDIESWLTQEGKAVRDSHVNSVKYGETKTYATAGSKYYPDLYAYEKDSGVNSTTVRKDGIGLSEKSASGFVVPTTKTYTDANDTGITVTQNYWNANMDTATLAEGYSVLYSPNYYWVASRYSSCDHDAANFGLRIAGTNINGNNMFYSNNTITNNDYNFRPVITLGTNIQITSSAGENSIANTHTINW